MSKAKLTRVPTLDERYELINRRVTLNEKPAIIKGYKTEFAHVCAQAFPFEQAEYSWSAVERIIESNKGRFSTKRGES